MNTKYYRDNNNSVLWPALEKTILRTENIKIPFASRKTSLSHGRKRLPPFTFLNGHFLTPKMRNVLLQPLLFLLAKVIIPIP